MILIYIYKEKGKYIKYESITLSIRPGYYKCPNCKEEYICNLISLPPCYPKRPGDFERRLGYFEIKEIIQIELENGKIFEEWEYENRIFKDNILK